MPTHQGKTQTDILIGGGGDSVTQQSSFEFVATYDVSAVLEYQDAASGGSNQDSRYELVVKDATGATLATFAAKYTAEAVLGTATSITTTKTNTFSPSPNGSSPNWPTAIVTSATRTWEVACTQSGSTFATPKASWNFVSTVKSGGSVGQVINTQNSDKLEVTLTYTEGRTVLATVAVFCEATVSATAGVSVGSPTVSDSFSP